MRHTAQKKILLGSTAMTVGQLFPAYADGQPTAGEVKAAMELLNKTFGEFKDANDARIKGIEQKFDDVVTNEKVDRINSAVGTLQQAFDDMSAKLASARLGGGSGSELTAEAKAHKEAFDKWFRRGDASADLKELQVKAALTTSSDPDAGLLVPKEVETSIDRVMGVYSVMRQLSTVRSIGAKSYSKYIKTDGAASGWVGETEARPKTDGPKISELTFPTMELYANPYATQDLLDDAQMDIGAWLSDEVNIEFAEQEGAAFINGDGVKKPRGLLKYDTVANASYAWGKIGFLITGVDGAFATASATVSPADKLIDLIYSLKPGYRNNASFLMNSLAVASVRKFKDAEGNYLWQPSAQAGQPSQLLGYAVNDDDNMPVLATGSLSVAFGDYKRAYLVVDRIGIRVVRDAMTDKPYIQFYTTKRVGGGVQNFEAVKLLKFSAS